jgi:iron complex outermembrane receptor protein
MKRVVFLSGILLSTQVFAETVTGVVTDDQGRPLEAAKVSVVGSRQSTLTNPDGQFSLQDLPEDGAIELHVTAQGYSHLAVHVEQQNKNLQLVLQPTVLEQIDVYGLPIHASNMESVQPISVIRGDELRRKSASTLGETLKNEAGIHSTYYGPVSSSPIIRGMDGPRVQIAQNGLDVADASRIGPDHSVATETGSAEQIEVLRGPATLFYGTGAIGGVVNIVDDRVPRDNQTRAHFNTGHNSVADENYTGFGVTSGADQVAYHLDGFWRDGNNYKIPADDENRKRLANSASSSASFNAGGSYFLDNGLLGISFGKLTRDYGIPGHQHNAHDHDDDHDHDEHEDIHQQEDVRAKLQQNRWLLIGEFALNKGILSDINTKIGYSDYQHREIHDEHADDGSLFKNKTLQTRVDFLHREILGWRGALSSEYKTTEFSSEGAEAFTPQSDTDTFTVALIEEKHSGALLWQLGARIEKISLKTDSFYLPDLHNHGESASLISRDYDFTPYSLSAGVVWDFADSYKFGISYAHAQRAPSAAELFALGPHIGTQTFEIGAMFDVHEVTPDHFHLEIADEPTTEKSNNIDISLRKHKGAFGFIFNIFYNEISDYFYQADTGLTTHQLFGHEGEEEHEGDLPVYIFRQSDAVLYGAELQFTWRPAEFLQWTLWGDNVQAELKSGEYLPRTPPKRLGVMWDFNHKKWNTKFWVSHLFDQDNTAPGESATNGYTLINAEISYSHNFDGTEITWYLQGDNLTDEYAQVHSSFLKDLAPLHERGFRFGIRGSL